MNKEKTGSSKAADLHKQAEEIAQEKSTGRERYLDLYDLEPVAYLTLSKNGMIQETNPTATNLLEVARSVLVRHPLSRFILPSDHDIYYRFRELIFKTALPQVCELRMMRQSGIPFWARLEAIASLDADGAPVCRVVISDITDRKKTEELMTASENGFHNKSMNRTKTE